MRIRKMSPFYGITEEQKLSMLANAESGYEHDLLAEWWAQETGRPTETEQVTRFLARLRHEREVRDSFESVDDVAEYAEGAASGKARDGLIEAARHRLFEEAIAKGDKELLLELYRAADEERARERELEVSRRKAAVAEENAKIGWRRLQLQESVAERMLMAAGAQKKLVKGEVVSAADVRIGEKLLQEGTERTEKRVLQENAEGAESGGETS